MTVRAPTSFVQYPDESFLMPRTIIQGSEIGDIRANQQYLLDAPSVYVSEVFQQMELSGVDYSFTTGTAFRTLWIRGLDMCGTQATSPVECTIRAWVAASTGATFLLDNVTSGAQLVIGEFTNTTPAWQTETSSASSFWTSDGSENEIDLYMWRSSGSGEIYIDGIFLEIAKSW